MRWDRWIGILYIRLGIPTTPLEEKASTPGLFKTSTPIMCFILDQDIPIFLASQTNYSLHKNVHNCYAVPPKTQNKLSCNSKNWTELCTQYTQWTQRVCKLLNAPYNFNSRTKTTLAFFFKVSCCFTLVENLLCFACICNQ